MTGTILIHVRIGKLCIRARFSIVHTLAVDLLLRISFIDRCRGAIVSGKPKLISWQPTSIAIINSHSRCVSSFGEKNDLETSGSDISTPVPVSKRVLIAPFMQHVVQAGTPIHGFLSIMSIRAVEMFQEQKSSPPTVSLMSVFHFRIGLE